MSPPQRLKILSLDGGGVRGLSALIVLQRIFNTLKAEISPPEPHLKPCDFFDLIGGVSTGGIIAIMLGRLRMSIEACIAAYKELGEYVFANPRGPPHQEKFDAERLERAVRRVVQRCGEKRDAQFWDSRTDAETGCKTIVFTISEHDAAGSSPVRLRTYSNPLSGGADDRTWTIVEAARATSAAVTFFEPLVHASENFFDGALNFNNPSDIVRQEIGNIWGRYGWLHKAEIGLFLSLGAGVPKMVRLTNAPASLPERLSARFQKPLRLVDVLQRIVFSPEEVAAGLNHEFHKPGGHPSKYHRFSVEQGLEEVKLHEYEKESQILRDTDRYLGRKAAEVNRCAELMVDLRVLALKMEEEGEGVGRKEEAGLQRRLDALRNLNPELRWPGGADFYDLGASHLAEKGREPYWSRLSAEGLACYENIYAHVAGGTAGDGVENKHLRIFDLAIYLNRSTPPLHQLIQVWKRIGTYVQVNPSPLTRNNPTSHNPFMNTSRRRNTTTNPPSSPPSSHHTRHPLTPLRPGSPNDALPKTLFLATLFMLHLSLADPTHHRAPHAPFLQTRPPASRSRPPARHAILARFGNWVDCRCRLHAHTHTYGYAGAFCGRQWNFAGDECGGESGEISEFEQWQW